MTDRHPLLTEENVYYWYWECDPAYSMKNIADEIGCSLGCIQKFMESRNIPRRSTSEAGINRYKDPEKLEAFLKSMHDPYFKKKQSEIRLEMMADPYIKKITFEALEKAHEMCVGKTQKLLMQIIIITDRISGNEISRFSLIKPSMDIYKALKELNRRGFINLKKIKKKSLAGNQSIQSEYSLTEKGEHFIKDFPLEAPVKLNIKTEIEKIRKNDNNQKVVEMRHKEWLKSFEESQKFYIGKTQLLILTTLENYGPKIATDIKNHSDYKNLSIYTIRNSLIRLHKRGLVSIVINNKSNRKRKPYLYSITELGKGLLAWKKKV